MPSVIPTVVGKGRQNILYMENSLTDSQKQECNLLLEEYKRINDEILKRVDYCDKNINYQFILLGIVATGITAILNSTQLSNSLVEVKYILLIAPIIFNLLGFYYSINNMYTFKISQYITNHIKPRLTEILNTEAILGFDHYIQVEVFKKAKESNKAVTLIVLQWTLSIPIILLGAYAFLEFSGPDKSKFTVQLFLLIVNVILITISIKINFDQYKIIFSNQKLQPDKIS